MKDFDYIIIGGCSGLSLAFELNKNNQLIDKTQQLLKSDLHTTEIELGRFGE